MQKRVLVYDDADRLEMCKYLLEIHDYDVDTRGSCCTVILDLEKFSPGLVITDNLIPETGGVAAGQKIESIRDFTSSPQ